MNLEQLEAAKKLAEQIEVCKTFIAKAKWTQYDNVKERPTVFKMEFDSEIVIPETLFKIFGKLLLAEYQQKLAELQKQFNDL